MLRSSRATPDSPSHLVTDEIVSDIATQIAIVQHYIRDNERRIAEQRSVLRKFQHLGLPTRTVEDLLLECEMALALHKEHLELLMREQHRPAA